jgi:hypothetical protein
MNASAQARAGPRPRTSLTPGASAVATTRAADDSWVARPITDERGAALDLRTK